MISNAGTMGLDWRWLSLSSYFEALEAHNDAQSGEKPKAEASAGLKSFMKAHGVGGNAGKSGAAQSSAKHGA